MWDRIAELVTRTPEGLDPYRREIAVTLNVSAVVLGAGTLLAWAVAEIALSAPRTYPFLPLLPLAACALALVFSHSGRPLLGGAVFVASLWAIIVVRTLEFGTEVVPTSASLLVVVVAGVLLGRRWALTATGAVALSLVGLHIAEQAGWLEPPGIEIRQETRLVFEVTFIGVAAGLLAFWSGRVQESFLRTHDLYEHAPDMIASVGFISGRIADCNAVLRHTLGRERDELVGTDFGDLVHPSSRNDLERALEQLEREGSFQGVRLHLEGPDGEAIPVDASGSAAHDAGGYVVRSRLVLRDVSRQVRAEQEREEALRERELALENVKVLRGLLPICGYCKKIRDDRGYWDQLEAYIARHSDARFSHGICEECYERQLGRATGAESDAGKG